MPTVYQPDAVFTGGALRFGASLAVGDDGRVLAQAPADAAVVPLPRQVLLPGLVNAHSHAFQRVLRGRTEHRGPGLARDDFWSWRELMYAAAQALTPDEVYAVSRQAFLEMALAGITAVGEFHYLHHGPDGTPYDDVHELALQVARAAANVGLRLVLLRVAYARAGFGASPDPRQRRFLDPDVEVALERTVELGARLRGQATVGLAPHSVRAVPRGWLEALARGWRGGPLHLHAAEQQAEVDACLAEHRLRPVELLDEVGLLRPGTTLVHGIHLGAGEAARLARGGVAVCACPSTERSLGDGVVPADALAAAGVPLCLGTDSQAHLELLEEARLLEGHLRLARQQRNVLDPGAGTPDSLARWLLGVATEGGAASLGLPVGRLDPGQPADFFTVARDWPALQGLPAPALLAGIVFAAPGAAVREVVVQGRRIVRDGGHAHQEDIGRAFRTVMARITSI
jgi:formimidoylglutamate deiminase